MVAELQEDPSLVGVPKVDTLEVALAATQQLNSQQAQDAGQIHAGAGGGISRHHAQGRVSQPDCKCKSRGG